MGLALSQKHGVMVILLLLNLTLRYLFIVLPCIEIHIQAPQGTNVPVSEFSRNGTQVDLTVQLYETNDLL